MDMPLSAAQAVVIAPQGLKALLRVPERAIGMVVFAHGSGSGRLSPRNNHVAAGLARARLGSLLLDLLTPAEERDRRTVFDIALLASRLRIATGWLAGETQTAGLPVGYFGASTGAGAALVAASHADSPVRAVVSRGGRPDLAGDSLPGVRAPTLLIVGSLDETVIELNRQAARRLTGIKELAIVPGAGHLFEEPGTLDQIIDLAALWFSSHLPRIGIDA
jgi:putative phosphoribosyl transferase